ncbi:DUF368 domain-containing protein [Porticoccus sp.]|nr:DUF368 domain-containing protein [Porticoccus sp.]
MGIADLVPGVSGGTIALISGIYEELIESIASINLRSIKILKKEGFYKFWCAINGSFILAVFSGALFSIIFFFSYSALFFNRRKNFSLVIFLWADFSFSTLYDKATFMSSPE